MIRCVLLVLILTGCEQPYTGNIKKGDVVCLKGMNAAFIVTDPPAHEGWSVWATNSLGKQVALEPELVEECK